MKAYMQGITKQQFVAETKLHQLSDNFIKGSYDNGEKGCAVGCALKSVQKLLKRNIAVNDHLNFEKYLGIPEWLARVEDTVFEGLPP